MGGRRRRRTQKKGSKKMRGGMGYGMSGTIGTAGALYTPSWGGEVTKAGTPVYDTLDPQRGSSRRRRKSKKSRKTRKMRGGAQWQSAAGVGYGYTGTGSRGLADPTAYASKVPPSGAPSQNPDGAYHV